MKLGLKNVAGENITKRQHMIPTSIINKFELIITWKQSREYFHLKRTQWPRSH